MKIRGKSSTKLCECCKKEFEYETCKSRKTRFCSYSCSAKMRKFTPRKSSLNFITKASNIHNSKYDYSNVDLTHRSKDLIEIICPFHGSFFQDASQHLMGKGCKKCALEKSRKTLDQFILEAEKIHGKKYDYSLVEYVNYNTHVSIICPSHGIFKQSPSQHIGKSQKAGCSECKKIIRISKEEKNWLDFCGVPDDADHRQVSINRKNNEKYFIVDGISSDKKIVYEYLGDYWHGNPEKFPNGYNKSCKKTFQDLYSEMLVRFAKLEELGYKVEYIWESQWLSKKD